MKDNIMLLLVEELQPLLTLSCPMWHLCGILTLAIYISPNNGPIDLHLGKEIVLHVMAIISTTWK